MENGDLGVGGGGVRADLRQVMGVGRESICAGWGGRRR